MKLNNIFSNLMRGDEGGKSGNVVQIEDNNYIFDVYLWNGETKVGITYASIEEFKIVDDLRYFYSYGYILFNDSKDVLESFSTNNSKPYNFRGDGRDYLQVEIMPQLKDCDSCLNEVSERERNEFCLKYTFSIYKIEEELTENTNLKYKKLYFWDVDYQLLNEIDAKSTSSEVNLQDSSGLFGFDRNPFELNSLFSFLTNSNQNDNEQNLKDNKRYTGDILKYIFDKSLNKITQSGFKASYDWDQGSSLIEYHTNGTNKAIDDIQYILNYHTSANDVNKVPCILKKTRYNDDYTLIPISKYLEKSVSENFIIGKMDTADNIGLGSILNYAQNQSNGAFNAINYNVIQNYSFLKPETDMTQTEIATHFVHSYDPNGFFTCSIKNNNIQNNEKTFSSLFNFGNASEKNTNTSIPVNQIRKENFNVQHKYVSGLGLGKESQKINSGKNKSLLSSIFKSSAIYFRIRGMTKRRSGNIFSINRNDKAMQSENDNTLLGEYLTTIVVHDFTNGTYYNHMYGTKQTSNKKVNFIEML